MGNGDTKSLREAMDFFSLSNNDISLMIGVDRTHISLVVNGKRFLTIEKAIKLAGYFKKHHKLDINWKALISEKNRVNFFLLCFQIESICPSDILSANCGATYLESKL